MSFVLRSKKIILAIWGVSVIAIMVWALPMISAGAQQVTTGQRVVVTVSAESVEDMYGYQFQICYNEDEFEYDENGLVSRIGDITLIFSKPFSGYQLVGATMIGDRQGVFGKDMVICRMVFTAKKDSILSDQSMSLSGVNIVKSNLAYEEDISNWKCKVAIQS